VSDGVRQRLDEIGWRNAKKSRRVNAMRKMVGGALVAICSTAMCAGCATTSSLGFLPWGGSEKVAQHAADVLIDGVNYTRESGREVAGWCWSDRATGKLAYVAQDRVGEYEGVEVGLPRDRRGTAYVSCSWHTHPWGPHVAPGPSKRDLRNSMLPWVSEIPHFVLDQQGIWQYANGRVVEMCPWSRDGASLDTAGCRS
jgi:hypothetical protein